MSGHSREDAVLGEVLVNENTLSSVLKVGEQDDDYALAKVLQEQERAFLLLHAGQAMENNPPHTSGGSSHEQPEVSNDLNDEEYARRLQDEEQAEHYRHMLALAGIVPGEQQEEEFEEDPVDPDTLTYEELSALGEAVGTVSKGITQAQLSALPVRMYKAVLADREEAACADEQCAVCRLEYQDEDEVRVLPCQHYYHPECVGEWLRSNKVCPVCSKEVVESLTT